MLITLCRIEEAERIVADIEHKVNQGRPIPPEPRMITVSKKVGTFTEVLRSMLTKKYPYYMRALGIIIGSGAFRKTVHK